MALHFYIPKEEIDRLGKNWKPDASKMIKVSKHIHELVQKRFDTEGASGGKKWASKRHPDGRMILRGRTSDLRNSWYYGATNDSAFIVTRNDYAHVHQLGTIGKGGTLPTIVPKVKKALWVPLTDKAALAYETKQFNGLIQGKFVNGVLEPSYADYVWLKKVDIPPRPMLPDSPEETKSIIEKIYQVLFKK